MKKLFLEKKVIVKYELSEPASLHFYDLDEALKYAQHVNLMRYLDSLGIRSHVSPAVGQDLRTKADRITQLIEEAPSAKDLIYERMEV